MSASKMFSDYRAAPTADTFRPLAQYLFLFALRWAIDKNDNIDQAAARIIMADLVTADSDRSIEILENRIAPEAVRSIMELQGTFFLTVDYFLRAKNCVFISQGIDFFADSVLEGLLGIVLQMLRKGSRVLSEGISKQILTVVGQRFSKQVERQLREGMQFCVASERILENIEDVERPSKEIERKGVRPVGQLPFEIEVDGPGDQTNGRLVELIRQLPSFWQPTEKDREEVERFLTLLRDAVPAVEGVDGKKKEKGEEVNRQLYTVLHAQDHFAELLARIPYPEPVFAFLFQKLHTVERFAIFTRHLFDPVAKIILERKYPFFTDEDLRKIKVGEVQWRNR